MNPKLPLIAIGFALILGALVFAALNPNLDPQCSPGSRLQGTAPAHCK